VRDHLSVLLERIHRVGISTVPKLEEKALLEWSDCTALEEIGFLEKYLESRKADMISEEKERARREKASSVVSKCVWKPIYRMSKFCN